MKKKILLKKSIIPLILITLIFIVFRVDLFSSLVIILLILLACVSKVYKRFIGFSFGFELVTPVAIILAFKTSLVFSILSSIAMIFVSDFLSGEFIPPALLWQTVTYGVMCVFIFLTRGIIDFLILAMIGIIFRNVFLFVIGITLGGADPFKIFLSNFPNIFINGFLILEFGRQILLFL